MSRFVPKVVLDTNSVLSALLFPKGRLVPLRVGWQAAQFVPLVSKETASELIRALSYPKFKLSPADQQELLADYLPYCLTVKVPEPPPETPICRDPADIPFLQLARAGNADYLVTGDQDLLVLADSFVCQILSPAEMLTELS